MGGQSALHDSLWLVVPTIANKFYATLSNIDLLAVVFMLAGILVLLLRPRTLWGVAAAGSWKGLSDFRGGTAFLEILVTIFSMFMVQSILHFCVPKGINASVAAIYTIFVAVLGVLIASIIEGSGTFLVSASRTAIILSLTGSTVPTNSFTAVIGSPQGLMILALLLFTRLPGISKSTHLGAVVLRAATQTLVVATISSVLETVSMNLASVVGLIVVLLVIAASARLRDDYDSRVVSSIASDLAIYEMRSWVALSQHGRDAFVPMYALFGWIALEFLPDLPRYAGPFDLIHDTLSTVLVIVWFSRFAELTSSESKATPVGQLIPLITTALVLAGIMTTHLARTEARK
jgi:hypothetical protein